MLFTVKRPFNLPHEPETSFTVNLNRESIIEYLFIYCASLPVTLLLSVQSINAAAAP